MSKRALAAVAVIGLVALVAMDGQQRDRVIGHSIAAVLVYGAIFGGIFLVVRLMAGKRDR